MFDSEIARRPNRIERRLMKKRGQTPPKVLGDGLPAAPPLPPDPIVLTEGERLALAPHIRRQVDEGVDSEGNPLGPRERERLISILEQRERIALEAKRVRALLAR